ncbi:hypothetical protein [uncultured Flavobacterium sp.]|uniref:hypothetical protein n=1 Tax=uncultured Flavobacterium sp. TaxID=165435 RepID=UPI00261558A5|nr:hypothetical protein [uncultured Flavobacterium sp.]
MKKIISVLAKVGFVYSILKLLGVDFLDEISDSNTENLNNSEPLESMWIDTDGDGINDTELRDINNDGIYGTLEEEIQDNNDKIN